MMQKPLLLLSVLGMFLFAFKQEKQTNYYWVSFRGRDYQKADTLKIDHFRQSTVGDTSKVSYITKFGYTDYNFVKGKDTAFIVSNIIDEMLHPNDSIIFSRLFRDTLIVTKTDSSKVSEYILNEDVQDGAVIYYFTPKLGVYAIHSDTWPGLRFMQSNDSILNRQIMDLVKKSVPKFFIRGKLEN